MKVNEILSEARKLIEAGKKEFSESKKTTKYYVDSEYNVVYAKAR